MSKLAVLILAAGSSSRMGFPKQLLKWKNTTLLQHAINTVKEVALEHIVLVLGANSETIKSEIDKGDMVVLYNENWEQGLGNSIAFGIKFILESLPDTENILIMLADQPLIDSKFLNSLKNTHDLSSNAITCTLYQNKRAGVPAIFHRKYFQDLLQLNGDKGAKELLKKYSSEINYLDGTDIIIDIDTIEIYESLYKRHH